MPDFLHSIQSGSASAWLFFPTAIVLGILHGLEPGHSKTMMAAFIIAIRGTFWQALLLGLSAALSHTLIIAVLAALALQFGSQWNAEQTEPYLQLISSVLVLAFALWMFLRTRRELREASQHQHHHHHHHDETKMLDTGHNQLELSVFEDGVPPVFRLRSPAGEPLPEAGSVSIETLRDDGTRQTFAFTTKERFLESLAPIPEPHAFDAVLTLIHGTETHTARAEFREPAHHDHDHDHDHNHGTEPDAAFQDAHEREHAEDIAKRFSGRTVTTPQIVLFGITGGLIPCPAALSVAIVCLQLKRFTLGFAMVGAFGIGLAVTMVSTGLLAAWSVRHAEKRFRGFGEIIRRAPYISCALLVVVAFYMAWHGWHGLPR